jgi:CheY-like chemotaxis protein
VGPVEPASARPPRVSPGRVVVIAEDAPGDARVTESLLVRDGYLVRVAASAESALALLAREVPSLLIVDLGLPGMSGFALIERVRADPSTRAVPIMVLTARDLSEEETRDLKTRVQLIATKGVMTGSGFHDAVTALCDASARRPDVLIIDDSEMNRRVAAAMLKPAGYLVREASDAEGGIVMAFERVPDAILMDVRMPGVDGLEATARLRADARTRSTAIIAVSAHAMPGDGDRALGAGCDAYITKPVARQELLSTLEACIKKAGERSARA